MKLTTTRTLDKNILKELLDYIKTSDSIVTLIKNNSNNYDLCILSDYCIYKNENLFECDDSNIEIIKLNDIAANVLLEVLTTEKLNYIDISKTIIDPIAYSSEMIIYKKDGTQIKTLCYQNLDKNKVLDKFNKIYDDSLQDTNFINLDGLAKSNMFMQYAATNKKIINLVNFNDNICAVICNNDNAISKMNINTLITINILNYKFGNYLNPNIVNLLTTLKDNNYLKSDIQMITYRYNDSNTKLIFIYINNFQADVLNNQVYDTYLNIFNKDNLNDKNLCDGIDSIKDLNSTIKSLDLRGLDIQLIWENNILKRYSPDKNTEVKKDININIDGKIIIDNTDLISLLNLSQEIYKLEKTDENFNINISIDINSPIGVYLNCYYNNIVINYILTNLNI